MHSSEPHRGERRVQRKDADPRRLALAEGAAADPAEVAACARLLTVRFAGAGTLVSEAPCARLTNSVLGESSPVGLWFSDLPAQRGRLGRVDWAENGSILFGSLASHLEGDLARETEAHFSVLLEAAEAQGFPHLLRVWNFLPGINAEEGGIERYKLFNCGRAAAFDARYGVAGAEMRFSASSAVGSTGDHLVSYFAAARSPGRHLGNPRQVHAFRYPTDYGPRPPSFTRATVSPPELGRILFLSGTASITGHETRHAGKLQLQLQETLDNIDTLLASATPGGASAARTEEGALPRIEEFDLIRVYLRAAADLVNVHGPLRRRVGPRPVLSFVEADICRADLLLEIEGVAGLPG